MRHEHPNKARMDEIQANLNSHPGSVAWRRWVTLRRSSAALYGNIAELRALLEAPNSNFLLGGQLAGNMHPEVQRRFNDELDRRLLNFGSSASALVDISRRILGDYGGTDFFEEYERRRAPLSEHPAPRFLRDLRNFLQHFGVAPIGFRMSRTDEGTYEFHVLLARDALLGWEKWSADVKQYLIDGPKQIPLLALVTDYGAMVRELYDWVFSQFELLHTDDVAGANALIGEYNRALTGREEWEREGMRVRPGPGPAPTAGVDVSEPDHPHEARQASS